MYVTRGKFLQKFILSIGMGLQKVQKEGRDEKNSSTLSHCGTTVAYMYVQLNAVCSVHVCTFFREKELFLHMYVFVESEGFWVNLVSKTSLI